MIDPRGMTLLDWTASVTLSIGDAWSFGRLDDESQWQSWAVGFLRAGHTSPNLPPDPFQFSDWREWAMRAYTMLEVT